MNTNLKVLIDARMLLGRFSGVARMVTQLVDHLARIPDLRVTALCGDEPYDPWLQRDDLAMLVTDFSRKDRSPARRLLWEATKLPRWIRNSGADVFHATWNSGIPICCPAASVLTVHDCIAWHEPAEGWSARLGKSSLRYSLRQSVHRAQRVVAVSRFTADQVAHAVQVDPARIRIIYNGVGTPAQSTAAREPSQPPYVLYVGGHEPRKNMETVLSAVGQYWLRYDAAMELHLTGAESDLTPAARAAYDRMGGDPRIRFLGSPTDDELARQYSGAAALLMLSRAEGFGLPVIEAMAHGCPVIAARCGSLLEIVGNAGILVDPDDAAFVADSIHQLTSTPALTKDLVANGRKCADGFNWKCAAESYVREYQLAASSRSSMSAQVDLTMPDFSAIHARSSANA